MSTAKSLCKQGWLCLLLTFLPLGAFPQVLPTSKDSSLFSGTDRKPPLPVLEAFPFYFSIPDDNTVVITWDIGTGYYLYRNQFHFFLRKSGSNTNSAELLHDLPEGIATHDEFFGDVEVYYGRVDATVHLPGEINSGDSLLVEYQGCAEIGFCYTPQTTTIPLSE